MAMALAALDQSIVATALPTIASGIGALSRLSWIVTSYLLATTVVVPLYGKLGDQYRRNRVLYTAIGTFLVGAVLGGLGQSIGQLNLFRAVHGFGGADLIALALSIIADLVAPRERGRHPRCCGPVFATASVAGPVRGGFCTDHGSWRWVFCVNFLLGGAPERRSDLGAQQRRPPVFHSTWLTSAGRGAFVQVPLNRQQDLECRTAGAAEPSRVDPRILSTSIDGAGSDRG